ncbi:hypothetical protein [Polaromonas sp.]|uniref:hypothetical protein n=1 Tax=Polaromonas sp. TaxID=1869339 RepID=UPI00352AFE8A
MSHPEIQSAAWFDEAFKNPQPVPTWLRNFSERICREFNINGSADPMYIANVAAVELDQGDGRSRFTERWSAPSPAAVTKLVDRLMQSYSANIPRTSLRVRTIANAELMSSTDQLQGKASFHGTANLAPVAGEANAPWEFHSDISKIVGEMLRRLPECWASDGERFDLATRVVIEPYPDNQHSIFAYQFMRATPEGEALANIATCIPDLKTSRSDWLQIQQPGGRPYLLKVPGSMDITDEVCKNLQALYVDAPMLQVPVIPDPNQLPESLLRLAQLECIRDMVKVQGVFPTMRMLGASLQVHTESYQQEDHDHPAA